MNYGSGLAVRQFRIRRDLDNFRIGGRGHRGATSRRINGRNPGLLGRMTPATLSGRTDGRGRFYRARSLQGFVDSCTACGILPGVNLFGRGRANLDWVTTTSDDRRSARPSNRGRCAVHYMDEIRCVMYAVAMGSQAPARKDVYTVLTGLNAWRQPERGLEPLYSPRGKNGLPASLYSNDWPGQNDDILSRHSQSGHGLYESTWGWRG